MKQLLAAYLAPLIARLPAFPRVWGMTIYYHLQRARGFPRVRQWFRYKTGYDLNLENPRSFNEKLTHRKLYCRDPIWIQVTDKVAVRDWLVRKGLVGDDLKLIPVLGVFRTPGELQKAKLPQRYIAKAAWASGRNVIVKNGAADLPRLTGSINRWLIENPIYRYKFLIWAAWYIPRRIIVEEFLNDDQGTPPEDYKFFVFHGRVHFALVIYGRFEDQQRNLYDRQGAFLAVERGGYRNSESRNLPKTFPRMIEVAERIGVHFDFVRIDLYSHAGQIYFGEITMTPENGGGPFRPQEFDFTAGNFWDYPR